ncbi:MAG: 16S rRNA (cytosine(1402)-N(4))-methyltransferase RsmH [bacterium]|nr:MAG: 16S rRNA (cytosine(1402)-N(4))-methyltransferase RsmH [bacterium]
MKNEKILTSSAGKYHESVMVKEVIESLHVNTSSQFIDCTLGTGGHTEAILSAGGQVLGIEADPKMLSVAKKRLSDQKVKLVLGNFVDIDQIAKEKGFSDIDGILLDLGVSNLHLMDDDRGFSFTEGDQELDMRLNPETQGVKASDLLNALNVGQLTEMFNKVMDLGLSRKWAKRVISTRPYKTVNDLKKTAFDMPHKPGIDSATLPMLALRIAVNSELENLKVALKKAYNLLKKGGRLSVIVFHSTEEQVVKDFMRDEKNKGKLKLRLPNENEIYKNKKSRSAKLYTYVKN